MNKAKGLPPELRQRLREALLRCDIFTSDAQLRALFTDERIYPWRNLPNCDQLEARVDGLIEHLHDHYSNEGESALALFLLVLGEDISQGNRLKREVTKLAKEIRTVLEEPEADATSTSSPTPSPFIPFVNRTKEVDRVVTYPSGSYYLFEAPAGYGKTRLLQKIEEEFKQRGWLCIHLPLESQTNPVTLIESATRQVQEQTEDRFQFITMQHETELLAEDLGQAIAAYRTIQQFPGVVLLIDVQDTPFDATKRLLRTVVEKIIPNIYDGLTRESKYFNEEPASYRVVLSGRSITYCEREYRKSYRFNYVRLRPLDYDVVKEICSHYIMNHTHLDEFSANLFFYSGGHPGCIEQILQIYKWSRDFPATFFDRNDERIRDTAHKEASKVRDSISKDLKRLYENLCIYRRLNYSLLDELRGHHEWYTGETPDLIKELRDEALFEWENPLRRHLKGDITRRLMAIQMRYDAPKVFEYACHKAKKRCMQQIEEGDDLCTYWAVEALFEYLQANTSQLSERTARQQLRHQLLEEELVEVLQKLVKGREAQEEYESLRGILDEDWEFRFVVNYYLRDATYNDSPYQELLSRIDQFFKELEHQSH